MAISNDLLSSTLYSIRDGEVDELYQKTAFLDNARKNGGEIGRASCRERVSDYV